MFYNKNNYYEDRIKQLEEENKLLKMEESQRNVEKVKIKYQNKIIPFREYMSVTKLGSFYKKYEMKEFSTNEIPFQEIMNKIDEIIDYINKEPNNE